MIESYLLELIDEVTSIIIQKAYMYVCMYCKNQAFIENNEKVIIQSLFQVIQLGLTRMTMMPPLVFHYIMV